ADLYASRQKAIRALLRKLQQPKASPLRPSPGRCPSRIPLTDGDYLLFQKSNGKYVIAIVASVETRPKLHYDFVFPNLSRSADFLVTKKLLDTTVEISDDELDLFFHKNKTFRITSFDHSAVKHELHRLKRFGNRKFNWSVWRCSVAGYGITFEDFLR